MKGEFKVDALLHRFGGRVSLGTGKPPTKNFNPWGHDQDLVLWLQISFFEDALIF